MLLAPSLREKGYDVLGSDNPENSSGITSFSSQKQDIKKLHDALHAKGFVISLRDGLDGSSCIRVAPHFYNTEEEIERFLDNVPMASGRK